MLTSYSARVRRSLALSLLLLALASARAQAAGRRGRPLFEPTDLELEDGGTLEADLQLGFVRGDSAARLVIPDIELDLGLSSNVELDVDGAYALEGAPGQSFSLDHAAPDSLWLSIKAGLEVGGYGLGVQLGPKFPTASGSHGLGGEALLLAGRHQGRWHLALSGGAFIDPDGGMGRPRGLEGGLDLAIDFGALALTGELGGVHFTSGDADQLVGTAGLSWSVSDALELSVVALVGVLGDGDRYGVLLGISPKLRLWR